jgi:hypothetical protein
MSGTTVQSDVLGSNSYINWVSIGIIAGLAACITYPIATLIPLPTPRLTLIVGASFGPALTIACWALGRVLQSERPSIAAEFGAVLNALAGALVTAMILVQLAVVQTTASPAAPALEEFFIRRVWDVILGMDVAFDMFIGLGTAFFGFAMLRDQRFGKIVGGLGLVIGLVVILGFNMATFPDPPAQAGLFDPGIVTGIFYFIVVIQMIIELVRLRRGS